MSQAASTDLFNPLVPKANNSVVSKSTIKPVKFNLKLIGGYFVHHRLGTNGLSSCPEANIHTDLAVNLKIVL